MWLDAMRAMSLPVFKRALCDTRNVPNPASTHSLDVPVFLPSGPLPRLSSLASRCWAPSQVYVRIALFTAVLFLFQVHI